MHGVGGWLVDLKVKGDLISAQVDVLRRKSGFVEVWCRRRAEQRKKWQNLWLKYIKS
jgi:hypothetical protein